MFLGFLLLIRTLFCSSVAGEVPGDGMSPGSSGVPVPTTAPQKTLRTDFSTSFLEDFLKKTGVPQEKTRKSSRKDVENLPSTCAIRSVTKGRFCKRAVLANAALPPFSGKVHLPRALAFFFQGKTASAKTPPSETTLSQRIL